MTKIFVPNSIANKELISIIREVENAGYDTHQAFIGKSFQEFAEPLKAGDVAVVYSLQTFGSVTEILATFDRMTTRGVELKSIQEPWFNDQKLNTKQLLTALFKLSQKLNTPLPKISRKKRQLPIQHRVATAKKLYATRKISLATACRLANCSISAYYTHRNNSVDEI